MKRSLAERLGLDDVYPKPQKAQADATAVKRGPLPPTDRELAETAKAARAKNPPKDISDDEVRGNQALDRK